MKVERRSVPRPLALGCVLFAFLPSLAAAQVAEIGVSLTGTTIRYYPRASAAECQADCAANQQCRGSTWIQAGTYNPSDSAMCYLLSAVTGRSQARGHVSLVKATRAQGPVTNPDDLDSSDLGDL